MPANTAYRLADLARQADVTPRTVRYYIAQGLLPSPGQVGPGVRYPRTVLARLRLIRQLQRQHLPLAEIRRRLAELTDSQVTELAGAPTSDDATESAVDYIRTVLAGVPAGVLETPVAYASAAPTPGVANEPSEESLRPQAMAHRRAFFLQVPQIRPTAATAPPAPSTAPPTGPAVSEAVPREGPDRSQWDRVTLTPDVELHVRRPLSRLENRRVERLLTIARQVLQEDES